MSDYASQGVPEDEGILRRIPKVWGPSGEHNLPPVQAFYPHKNDSDGLSVSRESITSADTLSRPPNGKTYHVARIDSQDITSNGMTVKPDPTDYDLGHCLIPELNRRKYDSSPEDKRWVKDKAAILATNCKMILIQP